MGDRLSARLRLFFATPARQAYGFAALGIAGLALGGAGILISSAGSSEEIPLAPLATSTAEATPSPSPTASHTPRPTATPTATPTSTPTAAPATRVPIVAATAVPTSTPTAEASTPAPTATATQVIASGGPYCPSRSASAPPNTVGGLVTIGGAPAPPGTIVFLAFDGVAGPSTTVTVESSAGVTRAGYAIRYNSGPPECANRGGAIIYVVVDGKSYATGRQVGDGGDPFIRLDITG